MLKLHKLLVRIGNLFKDIDSFGLKVAIFQFITNVFKCGYTSKHYAVLKYLEDHYGSLISEYTSKVQNDEPLSESCPIWICWFQGIENMPPIVRGCFESVKRNAGLHPVKLITLDNFNQYISLPQFIIKKLENEEISYTHFSDIVRNNILADHGGIWLDATIYLTGGLNEWNSLPFYTIKQRSSKDNVFVSQCKWTGFCMGGIKGNVLNSFVSDFFNLYHTNEHRLIDYFLIDYIIAFGYNSIPSIRKLIDDVPYSNPDIYYMQANMSAPLNEEELSRICKHTSVFKLNWRIVNPSDKKALYYYLNF